MNIAHIGRFSENDVDGISVSGYSLALAQKRLGHKVFFYGIGDKDDFRTDSTGLVLRYFRRGLSQFHIPAGLKRVVRESTDGIDIFHMHSVFIPSNFTLSNILIKYGKKYVVTPHGGYDPNVLKRGRVKKGIYFKIFEQRYLRNSQGIICVSEQEMRDVRRLRYDAIITYIPNIVNTSIYSNTTRKPDRSLVYLGRWDLRQKGLDRLLVLFARIEELDSSISLHLFGRGSDLIALVELANKLRIKNVSFNNPIYDEQKLSVLSRASVYIQTSRWEVFGMSVAEAMACGIPVAISRESYLSRVVERVGCGLVIDHYDESTAMALIRLVDDVEMNTMIGLKGKSYSVENFSAGIVAPKVIEFYKSILR